MKDGFAFRHLHPPWTYDHLDSARFSSLCDAAQQDNVVVAQDLSLLQVVSPLDRSEGFTMPITFVVDYERRRVSTRAEGVLTMADLIEHGNAQLLNRDPSYDELFDATGALVDLTQEEVKRLVSRTNETMRLHTVGATAIVATQPVVYGLGRMYATLCESVGARVGVFRTIREAEAWLDGLKPAPRID